MKKILTYLIVTILPLYCFSQEKIKVEYDYIVKLRPALTNNKSEEYKIELEKYLKIPEKHTLYYYNGNSFYKNAPKKSLVVDVSTEKVDAHYTVSKKQQYVSDTIRYYAFKNNDSITTWLSYPKMEKFYLRYKPLWTIKYLDETEKIDNYLCKAAELTLKNGEIQKIWYTEEIPLSTGPKQYYGFPGLVLKVDTPKFVCYATKISKDVKETDIEKLDPKLKVYYGEAYQKKLKEIQEVMSQPIKTEKVINL
ncbi:MAG: GLPGLI family protein [Bergeyella sp.]